MKKYSAISIKKITVLIAVLSIAIGTSAFAKPSETSYRVRQDFAVHFKKASDVNWKTAGQYSKATFIMDNEKASAFYNNRDEFFGISKDVFLEDLPQPATRTILTKYQDYTISSIIKFTDSDDVTSYFAQMQKDNKTVVVTSDAAGHTTLYPENSRL